MTASRVQGVAVEPQGQSAPADSPDASNTELVALRRELDQLMWARAYELSVIDEAITENATLRQRVSELEVAMTRVVDLMRVGNTYTAWDTAERALSGKQG